MSLQKYTEVDSRIGFLRRQSPGVRSIANGFILLILIRLRSSNRGSFRASRKPILESTSVYTASTGKLSFALAEGASSHPTRPGPSFRVVTWAGFGCKSAAFGVGKFFNFPVSAVYKFLQGLCCFSAICTGSTLSAAAYTVNNISDTDTGVGTSGTLRYCINQANLAGGSNTITFALGGTITLTNSLPPIGPHITTIDAATNAVTINGGNAFQPFFAMPGVTLSITSSGAGGFQLSNVASIGGDGGIGTGGGGGALGAGGGLFVADGSTVSITGVQFSNCQAIGGTGSGSFASPLVGGGGGGMNGAVGGASTSAAAFGGGAGGGGGYGAGGSGGAGSSGGGGGGGFFSGGAAFGGGGGGGSDLASATSATMNNGSAGATGSTGLGGPGGVGGGQFGGSGTGGSGNSGGGGGGAGTEAGGRGGNTTGASIGSGAGGGGGILASDGLTGGDGGTASASGFFGGGGGGGGCIGPTQPTGGTGGDGNTFAGGGGGGIGASGGNGGSFGGGGGGSGPQNFAAVHGGTGGYGAGGGGGALVTGSGGSGGTHGGSGGDQGGGGGGAALGGCIFVGAGGTLNVLNIPNNATIAGSITAGSGFSPPSNGASGAALGSSIFLGAGGALNFQQPTQVTVSGTIASDANASVTMNNALGTLVLAGANTYTTASGNTTLTAGTIELSHDSALSTTTLTMANATTLIVDAGISANNPISLAAGTETISVPSGVGTLSGVISGVGAALIVNGPGTFIPSNPGNTYSGGTTIQGAATVEISTPGNLGSGAGPLTFNVGTLELLSGFASSTISSPIHMNANATILSGIPAVNHAVFSGPITATPGGTLTIDQTLASTLTLSGGMSGANALTVAGIGTVILSGVNTYSGVTTVAASGTLEAGAANAFSANSDHTVAGTVNLNNFSNTIKSLSGAGSVITGGTSGILTIANGGIFSGGITGTGGLSLTGGILQLTTATSSNTYSGPTTISGGAVLQAGATHAFSASSDYTVMGTLNLNNFSNTIKTLLGAGSVTTGGAVRILTITNGGIFSGGITGSGGVTLTGGTFELTTATSANTYSGPTTIASGVTLQAGAVNALSANSIHTVTGTLNLDNFANTIKGLSGPGNVVTGGALGVLTVTNGGIFSGGIMGTGGLSVTGGTLQLTTTTAANTYSGATTISAGATLQAGAAHALSAVSDYTVTGTLNLNNFANTLSTLSGAGNVVTGGSSGTVTITNGGIFSGGITGSGGVTLTAGTLQLTTATSANTYSGQTAIAASATLQAGAANAFSANSGHVVTGTLNLGNFPNTIKSLSGAGNVVTGGALGILTVSNAGVFSGGITGLGGLSVSGGTLQLTTTTSANTYSGPTTIAGGATLQAGAMNAFSANSAYSVTGTLNLHNFANTLGSLSGAGSVITGGPLGTVTITNGGVFSGGITGSGGVVLTTGGTLQLTTATSANTYSGSTTIGLGTTLQAGATNAFSANSDYTVTGTLALNNFANAIPRLFGAGSVTTGGVAGILTVTNGGNFSGGISGPGGLIVSGGTLSLSGVNSYTGPTTVAAGQLIVETAGSMTASSQLEIQSFATCLVDGTVSSPVLIDFGGLLGGTGTVGNTTVNGILSPGNSIGTIHGASFTFNSGSTFLVEMNNTISDQAASTGPVTINGGTLKLVSSGFTTPTVSSYTVITASSVVENTPFALVNPFTRYNFQVVYNATDVQLVLAAPPPPFHVISGGAAAHCFDVLETMHLSDIEEVLAILNVQTPSQIDHSLRQMEPTNFNNIAFAEENVAERVRQLYTNHFFEERVVGCREGRPWRLWAAPFVEKVRQHGKAGLPGYLDRFSGLTAALDYKWRKHWMIAGGFSFASSEMDVPRGRASAQFKSYAGSLGAGWAGSGFFADSLFSYLYSPIEAKRKMHFAVRSDALVAQDNRTAKHTQGSNQFLGHLGGGYTFKKKAGTSGKIHLYPFVNLDYIYVFQEGYTETGAQSLDLKVHSKGYDLLRPEGGIGIGYRGCFEHVSAVFDFSVSYVHEFRFVGEKTRASFKPAACTFTADGLKPENNLISPSARLKLTSAVNGFSLTLGYHGEYGAHFIQNAGEAELRKAF